VPALHEAERLVERRGWYAAGFLAYEAAPAFDPAMTTRSVEDGFPLLWLALYPQPSKRATLPLPAAGSEVGLWTPSTARDQYVTCISRIKDHIASGQTYQVNYTLRLRTNFSGDSYALFYDLVGAQVPGYSAFVDTGRYVVCSASPELFFEREGDQISCRPMKGTVRRGRTLTEDQVQVSRLVGSEKDRAENVMIVDMVRNDLGRIADTGSVQVPALFTAERYPTLWQLTSTVTARSRASFVDLMAALFPCASITGCPKVSTMGIIADLETAPRRIYTGAIGFLAPGGNTQFNVAIRTALIDRQLCLAEYGAGGGIVWDSTPDGEYEELLLKAQVLTERRPDFSLLETMLWTRSGGIFLRERHARRMADSAAYFGISATLERIDAHLERISAEFTAEAKATDGYAHRVRLLLARDGTLSHSAARAESPGAGPLRAGLAAEPVNSRDVFLFHKTTHRAAYETARQSRPDCDDVLLWNERRELTEFTVGNLVLELDGELYTPPTECGLLPGTFREWLVEQGQVRERVLTREDLSRCGGIHRVNSVRKWESVVLGGGP
jgi:para-aminobenzoate synthetase/4-amino-4-deoxychorismate lyase